MAVSFSSELLSPCVPSTLKIQNCNFRSFIASLLHVDSRLTVNVKRLLKTEHSDPKENQVAGHQRILNSKEFRNLFYQIASFATRMSQLKICDFSGEAFKGFEVL